jgi:hypothetical protein
MELHLRRAGAAGATLADGFTVAGLLGDGVDAAHQHLPVPIPVEVRRGDRIARARLVDFYRRVNLVADLEAVLDGFALTSVKTGVMETSFNYLFGRSLSKLNAHLDKVARGEPSTLGDDLKTAAVGFRVGQTYGKPGWMGFEIRSSSRRRSEAGDGFPDAVQRGLLTGAYGLSRGRFATWFRKTIGTGPADVDADGKALAAVHYNGLTQHVLLDAPPALLAALTEGDADAFERWTAEAREPRTIGEKLDRTDTNPHVARFLAESPRRYGLKMLMHDWSKDPVLHDQPALLSRVRRAQLVGISRLRNGVPADAITQDFVVESGLYEVFARSIGMTP